MIDMFHLDMKYWNVRCHHRFSNVMPTVMILRLNVCKKQDPGAMVEHDNTRRIKSPQEAALATQWILTGG